MMAKFLRPRLGSYLIEWFVMALVIYLFCQATLLDGNDQQLQQTGEHNESATLPILTAIAWREHGEIPLWNPYMLTGFPHAGDPINHFWNPVATVPVMLFGGITGMKVAVFLSMLAAALGQWFLAHTFGARGIFRLWAGLFFALSGGLALFWRLGWFELFVGMAWFPWCFAGLWSALHRHDRLSLVLTALAIAMVITTGGGYYPFYLGVSLVVLTGIALYWHKPSERPIQLRRAIVIAVLAVGLVAVVWMPLIDGFRYTGRDAPPDYPQRTSQPMAYALFNYVVSDPTWFGLDALGKGVGYGWFYIGVTPLLAMAFVPWLYARFPWRRRGMIAFLALICVLLLWHANRHTPVQSLYDLLPFLYIFRFPNRLLVLTASPLIAAAALTWQSLLVWARRYWRGMDLGITSARGRRPTTGISMVRVLNVLVLLLLILAVSDLYNVNRSFAMAPHPRNQNARAALTWLKQYDEGLYYVNIGGTNIYWDWMAYAYELEIPVINFRYNRRVLTMDEQFAPQSPFNAQPKYVLSGQDQAAPPASQMLNNFQGVILWQRTDVLPYAFATEQVDGPITSAQVVEQPVQLDGPNRVVVSGVADGDDEHLVVLVSDYPGWRLQVDGERVEMASVNGYLGAKMLPGEHSYVFSFHPIQHDIGLGISLLTLLFCLWWVGAGLKKPLPQTETLSQSL